MPSLIGFGAFSLASLVIGIRLLVLAKRTRELPEFSIALAFLFAGFIGRILTTLATSGGGLPELVEPWALSTGRIAGTVDRPPSTSSPGGSSGRTETGPRVSWLSP